MAKTQTELPNLLKSWRDEYTEEDVKKHLVDNSIDEFVFDAIIGDGDILLKTHKGMLTCVDLRDIGKVLKAFDHPYITLEPYENEIILTMSWNVDPHRKHGRGTEEGGPDEPDCVCRGTEKQDACATSGCGFCSVR